MTDAEYEAQVARIKALREKWVAAMGLAHWSLVFHYSRDGETDSASDNARVSVLATCNTNWPYLNANLRFNGPTW